MKTLLKNRVLWYDGSITFTPDELGDFISRGGQVTPGIHVSAFDQDVKLFNKLNPKLSLSVKTDLNELIKTWNIPESYLDININKYIQSRFVELINKKIKDGAPLTDEEVDDRIDRIETEMKYFKEYDMTIIIKTIIYILDVFKQNNIIWGTGRGSSCASYVFYLIGLHNVDSVKHEIELTEFFK